MVWKQIRIVKVADQRKRRLAHMSALLLQIADFFLAQASRVSHGINPRLSPLTEPYVRVSYTAPVSGLSVYLRQDSGFDGRQVEQPQTKAQAMFRPHERPAVTTFVTP